MIGRAAAAALLCLAAATAAAQDKATPLRAAYLATNPTQAVRDPQTGQLKGVSVELANELARRLQRPVTMTGEPNPPAVIEAVAKGRAEIGFVAYEATRVGTVAFSQAYMLTQQTFIVPDGRPIRTLADVDQPGRRLGGTRSDSITLCLKRALKAATLVELDNTPERLHEVLRGGEIDALGGNRQRMTALAREGLGRVLDETYFGVPQSVIVPMNDTALLALVNTAVDELRSSGRLAAWVAQSGVVGLEAAPKRPVEQFGCPV
jgi:polar amino acid transport system substrate-binding protein